MVALVLGLFSEIEALKKRSRNADSQSLSFDDPVNGLEGYTGKVAKTEDAFLRLKYCPDVVTVLGSGVCVPVSHSGIGGK